MPRHYVKKADRVVAAALGLVTGEPVDVDLLPDAESAEFAGPDTPGPQEMPPASFWEGLIGALQQNKVADQTLAADLHAQAMKKALRPEVEAHAGISHYNPLGERDHPRPRPSHIYMLGPYPIADPGNYDTVTRLELELLDQLRPGDYRATKADGQDVTVTVKTDLTANGTTPYRTTILMPMANDEEKNNWPPLVQLLTQITTGEAPMQSFTRMQQRIRDLEAQLAVTAA